MYSSNLGKNGSNGYKDIMVCGVTYGGMTSGELALWSMEKQQWGEKQTEVSIEK